MKKYLKSGFNTTQNIKLEAGTYSLVAYVKSLYGNTYTFALGYDGAQGVEWTEYDVDVVKNQLCKVWFTFTIREKITKLKPISSSFSASLPVYVADLQLTRGNVPVESGASPFDFDEIINGLYDEIDKAQADANTSLAKTRFMTEIDGGLIYSAMMKLYDAGGTGDEMAGMSGIAGENKEYPAFWAGGKYDEAIGNTAKAIIRHDGSSKFTDTEITGTINAKNGTIEKLTMAPNGFIELPPTFASRKGRIDNSGIQLVYDGSNSQKIEWYTGTGTFAGLIAPNSQGHLSISSSFGVGIQSQLINIGTEAFAGNINIGSGLAEIDFNGSSINNIREMTNIGYTTMPSITFTVQNDTALILRHDTPLSILTSVGSNSFIKSIYMNNNNLLRDGTIKWILNRSISGISIAKDGNIRIEGTNDTDWAIKGYSLAIFVYSAGYWYKHNDHR